ncbi:hypothetical protein [Streptomyces collinus]|uniref:hypothetical protein n=1 Tax=Streptomyces collinus TaxID=42684 RepID=UPI00040FDA55|nr:hypothetical protein [Streptomyces collinus]UJA09471.1 hypothetical protein HGI10_34210 [Streptomyces collinus]UJA15665.1 hypothetical protein HGI09_29910 [Streptomyces collinus]
MSALLFVHGTGVRQPEYGQTLALLRSAVEDLLPDARVHDCYWGDVFGVPPGVGSGALPGAPLAVELDTAAESDLSEEDQKALLWGLLYEDPLTALRQPYDEDDRARAALGDRMGREVEALGRALADHPPADLKSYLTGELALLDFGASLTAVLDSAVGRRALARGVGPGRLPHAVATAAVAHYLGRILQRGAPLPWTTAERDEVVRIVTGELGGDARSVGRWALRASGWTARRFGVVKLAGRQVDRRRAHIMSGIHPQAGDILKYLVRGEMLRELIRRRVREVAADHGPVVVFAHSLGGIAAVDLLAQEELTGVRHLVTAGSQAAHLHEIGALPGLAPGRPLPAHFPRWTNVYDKRDLLGFVAEPVFPGRVRDVELSDGQPFLAAHSGYFRNPGVHELLAQILRGTV